MRLLLVSSAGGHLAQLVALRPWWEEHERQWVTFDTLDAHSVLEGENVRFGYSPTTRNIPNLLRNTRLARDILADYRPHLIISTGAGMAVPFFYLAHRYGASSVFLEVVDRIDTPTLTGRLVYPVADDFLVQWPEQAEMYPDARVIGRVI